MAGTHIFCSIFKLDATSIEELKNTPAQDQTRDLCVETLQKSTAPLKCNEILENSIVIQISVMQHDRSHFCFVFCILG